MSPPKRARGAVKHPPERGQAGAGVPFDPVGDASAECADTAARHSPGRAMPAPQTPLPAREIERLKARSAKSKVVLPVVEQHDPAAKGRRK